jgi:hypothetical protein
MQSLRSIEQRFPSVFACSSIGVSVNAATNTGSMENALTDFTIYPTLMSTVYYTH